MLWGAVLLISATAARAGVQDAAPPATLAAAPRMYVTLVPRAGEVDEVTRLAEYSPSFRPSLNLALLTTRRNRLEFSLAQRDVLTRGDRLQLRLASDAHVVAQLLSGGQFSEADDSWIAVLGLASRVRLSYTNGPWELSVSARRTLSDGSVRARFSYHVRF
jgi:hypothetical protein